MMTPTHQAVRAGRGGGFTLIELALVIAVIAAMLGLLAVSARRVAKAGGLVRELSAARQLMVAYSAYAYDHRGVLLPGYYNSADVPGARGPLPAYDEGGNRIGQTGIEAATYSWRLAPYLDYDLRGLYLDRRVFEAVLSDSTYRTYRLSVFPSMGINSVFVGGDTDKFAYQPQYLEPVFGGEFYVTRLSQVKRPTELIVFASARVNGLTAESAYAGARLVEGYFKVMPPYFREREWVDRYVEDCPWPECRAVDSGFISLRHQFRSAAIGFFDGHAGTLDNAQILDMRHWADQADQPQWTVSTNLP